VGPWEKKKTRQEGASKIKNVRDKGKKAKKRLACRNTLESVVKVGLKTMEKGTFEFDSGGGRREQKLRAEKKNRKSELAAKEVKIGNENILRIHGYPRFRLGTVV